MSDEKEENIHIKCPSCKEEFAATKVLQFEEDDTTMFLELASESSMLSVDTVCEVMQGFANSSKAIAEKLIGGITTEMFVKSIEKKGKRLYITFRQQVIENQGE